MRGAQGNAEAQAKHEEAMDPPVLRCNLACRPCGPLTPSSFLRPEISDSHHGGPGDVPCVIPPVWTHCHVMGVAS